MNGPDRPTDLEREASGWSVEERRLLELARGLDRATELPEVPVERFLVELERVAQQRDGQRRRRLASVAAALLLLSALAGWLELRTQRVQPLDAESLAQAKAAAKSAESPQGSRAVLPEPNGPLVADGRGNFEAQQPTVPVVPELPGESVAALPETPEMVEERATAVAPISGEIVTPETLLVNAAESGNRLAGGAETPRDAVPEVQAGNAQGGELAAGDIAAGDIAAGDIAAGDIAAGDAGPGAPGSGDAGAKSASNAPGAQLASIRAAFGRVWQRCEASLGAPTNAQLASADWWCQQPSMRATLQQSFEAEGLLAVGSPSRAVALQHALGLLEAGPQTESGSGEPWPADFAPALLWLGLEHMPRATGGLIARAEAAGADQGLAWRALALYPTHNRETQAALERALSAPASAASAVAALAEWPRSNAGRLLGNAWRSALAAERAGQDSGPEGEPLLEALARGLLALGPEGTEVLLVGLDAQTGERSAGQRAALAELSRLGEPEFAALLPKLTERLTREHRSAALLLLAHSAHPTALLALLELQSLGRGPVTEIADALQSGACAAPSIWIAAATSDLDRASRTLLLENLLSRGAPAKALPSLIAQTDLPLDARLWAASLVGDLGDAAAAQHLLEVSLALGPGQERLSAAGLQAVVRCLGLEPTLARLRAILGDQLGRNQWARLEANLEREQQQSRPLRLAEQLRPLLPLLLTNERAD